MGPPPPTLKTAASQIETGLYTEGFAAVLAEHAPAPISAPVEVRPIVRGRQKPNSDDWRHVAALGFALLLSTVATLWYEIVDPVWSIPTTIPGPVTISPHVRQTSIASLWPVESGTLLLDAVRATAAADEWVFATIDPILPVETAGASTAATVPRSQMTHRPAPELIASLVEAAPNAPRSSPRLPKDIVGVRPGEDLEKPVTGRNGEAKGTIENPFVDLYPGKPPSGSPNITTASGAETGASQSEAPHPAGHAPSGANHGQKDSKSDKPGLGGSAAPGSDKPSLGGSAAPGGPKAGKEKPSAGKSTPTGPQDNHNSSGGKPSPGKADQNRKGDADKKNKEKPGKDKEKPGKDKDKPGKDKDDKAKGKGPH